MAAGIGGTIITSATPQLIVMALKQDTGDSTTDHLTNIGGLRFATAGSTISNPTFAYTVDGQAVATYDASSLSQGAHTVDLTMLDATGHVAGMASLSFVLDSLAPTLQADAAAGRGIASALVSNVLMNDTDASGLHLSGIQFDATSVAMPGTGSVQVTGVHGILTVSADGNYSYQASTPGGDVFTQTVMDAAGNTSQTTLSLNVQAPVSEIFRFYDKATGDHFYTADAAEAASIQANLPTFAAEGTPWATPEKGTGTTDVFRFLDTVTGEHFFTTSTAERDTILKALPTFTYEGVAFQAYASEGTTGTEALVRFFNADTGQHHFATADEAVGMRQGSAGAGWIDEGRAFVVHVASHDLAG